MSGCDYERRVKGIFDKQIPELRNTIGHYFDGPEHQWFRAGVGALLSAIEREIQEEIAKHKERCPGDKPNLHAGDDWVHRIDCYCGHRINDIAINVMSIICEPCGRKWKWDSSLVAWRPVKTQDDSNPRT